MSEFNEQQEIPYPRGSGTGSVPVLFSLRNVQPAIVSSSANKTPCDPLLRPTDTSNVAMVPAAIAAAVPATAPVNAEPAKSRNQMYNGAILVLMLLLAIFAIRNAPGLNNTSTLAKESEKASSQEKAVDAPGTTFQAIRFQSLEPLDIGIAPIQLSSSDPKRESIGSSPQENTSETFAALARDSSDSDSSDFDSNQSSTQIAVSPTASGPLVLAASGATNHSAKPDVDVNSTRAYTSAPNAGPTARSTVQAVHNPYAASPSENKSASFASPAPDAIVDTGAKLTTRQLIDAYRTKQSSASSEYTGLAAKPASTSTVVNESVAKAPRSVGSPYTPLGNELPLAIPASVADPSTSSMPKEYQPLFPYEQNAIHVNSTGFPVPSTDAQSPTIRQPTLNGPNRQGQPTQPSAYAPYQPLAPAQGANSVGYPPSN